MTTADFPQFTPTEFYSTADKIKFAKHFIRFCEGGFKREQFKSWFYRQLSNTFSHIAHFDEDGFYASWFTTKPKQLAFLMNTQIAGCYGDPAFTFCDVERFLRDWVATKSGLIEKLSREIADDVEAAERAELARLKAKYEKVYSGG